MLTEEPQHALIGACQNVVRHAVIEERIETLCDAPVAVGELVKAASPV